MFPFKSALNASTLFPYKLPVKEQIAVAAEAGYEGIELWVRDIEAYTAAGGSLASLKQHIDDKGIALPNAIAFFKWCDADPSTRRQGIEQAKREMSMLAELGCTGVAAPPFGDVESVSLGSMAEAYVELSEIGRSLGVDVFLEFWGRAKKLSTLDEAIEVLMLGMQKNSKLLLDPFHMYTGGSNLALLAGMPGRYIGIMHANDYGSSPERAVIADKDRLFPGDGIAPSSQLAQQLHASGYTEFLSLELFMDDYGGLSALETAQLGLRKMKQAYDVEV